MSQKEEKKRKKIGIWNVFCFRSADSTRKLRIWRDSCGVQVFRQDHRNFRQAVEPVWSAGFVWSIIGYPLVYLLRNVQHANMLDIFAKVNSNNYKQISTTVHFEKKKTTTILIVFVKNFQSKKKVGGRGGGVKNVEEE